MSKPEPRLFQRIEYDSLNSRQREIYNFQKIAARLADYGYNCMRLTDDWEGADFIACHKDGEHFLKVQLKGRLCVDRKYEGKDIYMAFIHGEDHYVFLHDSFMHHMLDSRRVGERGQEGRWATKGNRSWRVPPVWALQWLEPYRL